MSTINTNIATIRSHIPNHVTMVCVSKFQPIEAIQTAYDCGERDFGESRVQELLLKQQTLPSDIRWHFIGHLQTNKVKAIVPFVHLIHSVDSWRLLEVINREAEKIQRQVNILLEIHVAKEETKSGFSPEEFLSIIGKLTSFNHVKVCGIMGMATNTDNEPEIRRCFHEINTLGQQFLHQTNPSEQLISMGMSDDYQIAISEGSNMVRIGSSIFGKRQTHNTTPQ